MVRRVFFILLAFMLVALVLLWLVEGGGSAVARTARTFTNPIEFIFGASTSTGSFITLPWQIGIPQGPDISSFAEGESGKGAGQTPEEYAAQYQALNARAEKIRAFGTPSPVAGEILIRGSATGQQDAAKEYVELVARGRGAPINITGWSLQSAVSGRRLFIPPAAPIFILGVLNNTEPVYLEGGASALVVSGTSPVGISFRENICSGYLNELQRFAPELSSACPAASGILAETPENLRVYGSACFDYVQTIPECHFPGTTFPSNISAPCRTFLANTLTYNGCVSASRYRVGFTPPQWRLYLNARAELWDNAHDIIRLLDARGQTVDVLTY